jgi:hypothetical protein
MLGWILVGAVLVAYVVLWVAFIVERTSRRLLCEMRDTDVQAWYAAYQARKRVRRRPVRAS